MNSVFVIFVVRLHLSPGHPRPYGNIGNALATDVAGPRISENILFICFLLVVVQTLEDFSNHHSLFFTMYMMEMKRKNGGEN
jgi:hypothetical protein